MRCSDLSLVFVIIALTQAVPACGADAAGTPAVSKFEIVQANVYEPPVAGGRAARAREITLFLR